MTINPKDLPNESLELNSKLRLFQIFKKLGYVSLKCDTYFQTYEDLFGKYTNKNITFVEIGVLHGGSLFMWREYFGPKARIIGIDLNPKALELEKQGFEIFIGSQSDKKFWKDFYSKVGSIDILLDDGGHSNDQQIVTLAESLDNINDGGLLVTEDVHTSYFKKFGNPSKFSFISYSKYLIDVINSRFIETKIKTTNIFRKKIYSITHFNSIVAIKVDSKKSIETTVLKNNENEIFKTNDLRTNDYFPKISSYINKNLPILHKIPIVKKVIRYLFFSNNFILKIKYYLKLKKYFK